MLLQSILVNREEKKQNRASVVLNSNTYTNLVISSPTNTQNKEESKGINESYKIDSLKEFIKEMQLSTTDFKSSMESRMSKLEKSICLKKGYTVDKQLQTDEDNDATVLKKENVILKEKLELMTKSMNKYKELYEKSRIKKPVGPVMSKVYDKKGRVISEFEEVLNIYKGTKLKTALDCFVKSFS